MAFFNPSTPYDPSNQGDVIAQQQSLARRQALLDAMTKANLGSEIKGNTGLGQALAQVATAYVLQKGSDKTQQDTASNQGDYGNLLSRAIKAHLGTLEGTPGQDATPVPADGLAMPNEGAAVPAIKGDPMAAVAQAMGSRFPELQGLGKAEIAGIIGKGPEEFGNPVTQIDPTTGKPVSVQFGKRGTVRPLAGVQPTPDVMAVGDRVVDKNNPGGPPLADYPANSYGPLQVVGTNSDGSPIQGSVDKRTGKIEYPPAGQNINIDTKGKQDALSEAGPVLKAARQERIDAQTAMQQAQQVLALSKDPQVIQGFGAGVQTGVAALGAKLGITGGDAVAKTQMLVSSLANATLKAAPNAHLSPMSDSDRTFLQAAVAGTQSMTPQAIQHIASLALATAHNTDIRAGQQYRSIAQGVPGVAPLLNIFPDPGNYNHTIPSEGFEQTNPSGLVQYLGGLTSSTGATTPAAPAASGPKVTNW